MTIKKEKPIHVNVDENLKEKAIPFMIKKGNKETLQALNNIKEGNVTGGFSSVDTLMDDLNT
ncbi:hypothetical protein I6R74_002640 [Enterococcus faecalis]|nr:hypothetical protein [Enterococcus faecalis]